MNGIGSQVVTQIAVVVRDMDGALDRYCRVFGMAKPDVIVTDGYDRAGTTYHGEPTEGRARLAFLDMGQVQIELIEPVGGPSTWQEHLDNKGEGVHHIAFWITDTEGATRYLGEIGIEAVQQGHFTGGRYTYYDSTAALGVMLELLERTEQ